MVSQYDENIARGLGTYHAQQWISVTDAGHSSSAMKRAAQILVEAHPVLRTRIVADRAGETVQAIRKAETERLDFEVLDISHLSAEERQIHIARRIEADRAIAFCRGNGETGLLRFTWFTCTRDSFVILMSIHHAIDDGWGNQHFLSRLFGLYDSIKRGFRPSIGAVPNVFKEYVALEHLERESKDARAFWRQRHLPETVAAAGAGVAAEHGAGDALRLSWTGVAKLYEAARAASVSIKAIALSAYIELVESLAAAQPVTVGVVTNGRSDRLSDPLTSLGLYWNLLPACVPLQPGRRREHMSDVHRTLVEMDRFATYPLTAIAADRGVPSLFFATFNFLNFPNTFGERTAAAPRITAYGFHDRFHYSFNFSLSLDRSRDRATAGVTFDAACFSAPQVEELLSRYFDLLNARIRR